MSRPDRCTVEPMHHDLEPFRIRIDLRAGLLFLAGPLNRSTVHLLHDAISTLLLTDRDVWVVDACHVTVFDRMGIHAIHAAQRRALRHHRLMQLVETPAALQEALGRRPLDHHLLDGDDRTAPVRDADPIDAKG
jgi:anti-anti-sigma regulatory factor